MIFNVNIVVVLIIAAAIFLWSSLLENRTQFFILAVVIALIIGSLYIIRRSPAPLNSEISEDISELSGCMLIVSNDSYLSPDNISLIRRCAIRATHSLEKAEKKPQLMKIELLKFDVEIDTIQAIMKHSHGNIFK